MISISVLLPTRGRPHGLRAAIETLLNLAAAPGAIEFLIRADDDDRASTHDVGSASSFAGSVSLRFGPRLGYRRVFEHYNELAATSRGLWIINWNDDVEMLTHGWDELARQAPAHSVQFFRRDILEKADTTFPCTGRSVYQAMGHLSLQTHADDWMRVVADKAGVTVFRDDIVFHHHRLNDQTSRDRDAGGYDTTGFNSPEMQALMAKDAENVRAAAPKESR